MRLDDKKTRLEMLERYLEASLTRDEERRLRDYYAAETHIDADEVAGALLLEVIPSCESPTEEADIENFDVITIRRRSYLPWMISMFSAAVAVLAVVFLVGRKPEMTSPAPSDEYASDIVTCLGAIVDIENVAEVASEQVGDMLILTLTLDSGEEVSYMVMKNSTDNKLSLVNCEYK